MLLTLPLSVISPNPNQPRKVFDTAYIAELASSIAAHGLLQPPTVRPAGQGYQIVAGECRFRAVKSLGWSELECNVRDLSDHDAGALSLIENLARRDMQPLEEARGLYRLLSHGGTVAELAMRVGMSAATITKRLALLDLSAELQGHIAQGLLPMRVGQELARILDHENQRRVAQGFFNGEYRPEDTARVVDAFLSDAAQGTLCNGETLQLIRTAPEARTLRVKTEKAADALRRVHDHLDRHPTADREAAELLGLIAKTAERLAAQAAH